MGSYARPALGCGRVAVSEHLAGVHDAVWIERLLDRPLQGTLGRNGVGTKAGTLVQADAVFGRNRAATFVQAAMEMERRPNRHQARSDQAVAPLNMTAKRSLFS